MVVQDPEGDTTTSAEPKTRTKRSASGRASSQYPVLNAGCPQQVWASGKSTSYPIRRSTRTTSIPTWGWSWSTKHGMNRETLGMATGYGRPARRWRQARLRKRGHRLHERHHHRMRLLLGTLWLAQYGHKKAMRRQLKRLQLSLRSPGGEPQPRSLEPAHVFRVHFVITEMFLYGLGPAVNGMERTARFHADAGNRTDQLRIARVAVRDRAQHGRDDDVFGIGTVLRRVRVGQPHDVARILYQSILEAPSSADERPVTPPRELDAVEHSLHALVRTRRRGPQPVISGHQPLALRSHQRRRWQPLRLDLDAQRASGMLQAGSDGGVRR